MAILSQYNTPGFVVDFPTDPAQQTQMNALWSANVGRWVAAAQIGDIYDRENYGPRPAFYNPLVTDTPATAKVAAIKWSAFPGRFSALFPDSSTEAYNHWSDYGDMPDITIDLCSGNPVNPPIPYGPTGPRGWQDEYCEWSVTRNAEGKITSVMFTCENPEYWLTLWNCDPAAVLEQYRSLVSQQVALGDLQLHDSDGNVVIDPATGRSAYNPLNKWNSGTHTITDTSGGAVHLTSSPNTLGAEFDLAACASIPRTDGTNPVTGAAPLVCCALFGRIGRNSDPTIGQNANALVNFSNISGAQLTLTDPPGLYIQTPDFSTFTTPDGSPASSYWTVVRGRTMQGDDPIDRILHATYAVPADKSFTVGDIQIAGEPITYGGQIVSTITMALLGTVFPSDKPNQTPIPCTISTPDDQIIPCAQGLQDMAVFLAYRDIETLQNEQPLSIPVLALPVSQGTTVGNLALPLNVASAPASADMVTVTVTASGVTVAVDSISPFADVVTLIVTVTASPTAAVGDCGIIVTVNGSPTSPEPALGLLTIVAAESKPATATDSPRPRFRPGRRAA